MKSKKGFTLIELLVVISIIALLLSILMPGLRKAKEVAKDITCRTNVRSLTLGFRLYTDSNNSKAFPKGSGTEHILWLREIENQTGEIDKVRYCPSAKMNTNVPDLGQWQPNKTFGELNINWIWNFGAELEQGAYGFNGFLYTGSSDNKAYWNTTTPPNAANVPVFADCKWVDAWPDHSNSLTEDGATGMMGRFGMKRHGKGINVGFVDGHAEKVDREDLWLLKWSRTFETKSMDPVSGD